MLLQQILFNLLDFMLERTKNQRQLYFLAFLVFGFGSATSFFWSKQNTSSSCGVNVTFAILGVKCFTCLLSRGVGRAGKGRRGVSALNLLLFTGSLCRLSVEHNNRLVVELSGLLASVSLFLLQADKRFSPEEREKDPVALFMEKVLIF